jgi:ornithine carbamoyltransferase
MHLRTMRHFLNLLGQSAETLRHLLDEAIRLKTLSARGGTAGATPNFSGRILGLIFEKPSLRTRASFEGAMARLGGSSIFLSAADGPMGQRESVADFARSLSQYLDAVVLRTFRHQTVEEFAAHSSIPVINGLSDLCHPCQALGDLLTVQEVFGSVRGRTILFIGDGNNVARSLAIGCGKLGARFILCAPEGYGFDETFLRAHARACPGGELILERRPPAEAVASADVIYTDVWTSMGQEREREERLKRFAGFQVTPELLDRAPEHARLMHCLPAHRGEEVSAEAIDGPRSIVFQQAGNRMHAQKALLVWLMNGS